MTRLVFDVGGTHLRMALADGEKVGVEESIPTPTDPMRAVDEIKAFLEAHPAQVTEAVGGAAGIVQGGTMISAGHLPRWNKFPIADTLERVCALKRVKLYNDAEIAGIGEARRGAGKDVRIVAYVTVSTGIGGALIIDGEVVPHALGFEPGRQIVDVEHGRTLESFVSGATLTKEFGAPPEELAHGKVQSRLPILAVGLCNLIYLWSPNILIVGGSLMNDDTGYPFAALVDAISTLPIAPPTLPRFARAALGDQSGLVGAALISLEEN